ncbi:Asp-tRNAAsn/Glu-tRNAGln amidotransferase A subunit-related amidase [Candidatus Purcelliella pentastirinorum]|uniref:Asp-tRNAAsn/Glu-tRNAGln amidotransferase A subunit-related amidase n=1 Tax=Candidatus Purcelliella pentastirinorum TaxID=472834 RepID=A0A346E061_9ENTR|nr:AtzE family amidohydrolase [Candidatus Purcelliella pentastirinorum]AXN02366.1 Asp-tRNAAsn/Glu-tRNAGln amidotransferase A subunit-related amidase [Candidatus Purcelliella pentastirinorum]
MIEDIRFLTISEINKCLIKGDLSAMEIAESTLHAIKKYNPIINAWTEITSNRMFKEANLIDKYLISGKKLSKLVGIPYAVKNLFDVRGYVTLVGSILFANNPVAKCDAYLIDRLSSNGALLSGMLNMDAYAYGFTTENSYYGTTRNPYDLNRIAGGSSGGSAAAVAAGLVHFSLGSDTNGSVRVPSSLCGVLSLKPTFGRLSRTGMYPFSYSLDHAGYFARNIGDLVDVYNVLQGIDEKDLSQSTKSKDKIFLDYNNSINSIRFCLLSGYFYTWCNDEVRNIIDIVSKALGVKDDIDLSDVELARSSAFIITAAEGGNLYWSRLLDTPELFEPFSRERLLAGSIIPANWYIKAQRFRTYFRHKVNDIFNNFDVLIAPATPCSATMIGQKFIRINNTDLLIKSNMGMLTQPISFIGLPVITVPIRVGDNLPIGIQLIAAPFKEDLCFKAALLLEKKGLIMKHDNLINLN